MWTCDVCVTKLLLTVTLTGALVVSGSAFQPIVRETETTDDRAT